jgi:glycosyltransferase involved in cell wall biosynthesis
MLEARADCRCRFACHTVQFSAGNRFLCHTSFYHLCIPAGSAIIGAVRIGFLTLRMLLGYGVDLVLAELAQRLLAGGHEVTVFATAFDETYAGRGINIEKVEVFGGEMNRVLPLYEMNASKTMRRLSAKLAECDVLVPATFPFYGARCAYAGPIIHFDFGNVPTAGFSLKGKANWQYMHFMETYRHALRADAVVTISRFLAQRFLPEAQRKMHIVHLGGDHYLKAMRARGDEQSALRARMRARLGIAENEIAIGCCTRLHRKHAPYKNLPELIKMWHGLKNGGVKARLVLVGLGSPEDEAWLRGEGALALPNLPPEDMPAFYSALDVYASPSLWEGFNLPLVEAAWFSVPAIAYNVAAHPETTAPLLAHSRGEFQAYLARLAGDAALRMRLGEESRQRATAFAWDATYAKFFQVLEEATRQ